MLFVYGNHDDEVLLPAHNSDGLSQLLPDGQVVETKHVCPGSPSPRLRVGGVHGIPSSKVNIVGSQFKKRHRDLYFRNLEKICAEADIVVLHSNTKLPGQVEVEGADGPHIYAIFQQGAARMLVHGHMHTPEVVVLTPDERVVVNCDCRVVVFLPETSSS